LHNRNTCQNDLNSYRSMGRWPAINMFVDRVHL
jgi:hypothetical protein